MLDAPKMAHKNRVNIASATVDSRRSSNKKTKSGAAAQNQLKSSQSSNFYTIPARETGGLAALKDNIVSRFESAEKPNFSLKL